MIPKVPVGFETVKGQLFYSATSFLSNRSFLRGGGESEIMVNSINYKIA